MAARDDGGDPRRLRPRREQDLVIARLVGGDPAIYVDMSRGDRTRPRSRDPIRDRPGVGALSAAAAALGGEVVTAQTDQVPVIARRKAAIEERCCTRCRTVAVYMGGKQGAELQERLIAAGYQPGDTLRDRQQRDLARQSVVRCRLDELDRSWRGETLAPRRARACWECVLPRQTAHRNPRKAYKLAFTCAPHLGQ